MAFLLVLTYVSVQVNAPLSQAVCGKIIVIDPGHGGIDAGAKGRAGVLEKDVVLDIGLRLAQLFNRAAVYTVLTRNSDEGLIDSGNSSGGGWIRLDLEGRVALATEHNADLFISIHANSFPEPVCPVANLLPQQVKSGERTGHCHSERTCQRTRSEPTQGKNR